MKIISRGIFPLMFICLFIFSEKKVVAQITLKSNKGDTLCAGTLVTYTATATSCTSDIKQYTWNITDAANNVITITRTTTKDTCIFTTKAISNGAKISATVYWNTACSAASGSLSAMVSAGNYIVVSSVPTLIGSINGKSSSVCEGTTNNYSVTPASNATSYTWALPNRWDGRSTVDSISLTPFLSSGTITVTANNVCGISNKLSLPIVMKPKPPRSGQIFGPTTVCAGTTNTYSVTPVSRATYYTWTISGNGWLLSGLDSSNIISFSNSVTSADGYLVVLAKNECGFKWDSVVSKSITVTPTPVIPSQSTTICSGNKFIVRPVNAGTTIVPDSTTYTWSKPLYSGNIGDVTGGTAKSIKSSINDVLVNHTSVFQTATYTVTPTSKTCTGAAFTTKVYVYPSPIITNKTVTICSGSTFTVSPVNGKGTLLFAGTTYSWAAPTVTGGITGFTALSGQTEISQTLNNPSNLIQTATYTVTPKSVLAGNCDGQPFLIQVSVNPSIVLPAQSFTVCNAVPFSIDLSNGAGALVPQGTKYSWLKPTYSGVKGSITGGEAQSNSSAIGGTLVNNILVAQIATYIVTPQVNTCIGFPFTVTVTVDPDFLIKNMSGAACNGSTINSIPVSNLTNFIPSGFRYSWGLPIVTGGIKGATAGSNQVSISQTLINPTIAIQTARYVVFPTSAQGCVGAPFIITDSILPRPLKPIVSNFSNEQTQQITSQICGENKNVSFNVNDPIDGCTYLWTALPSNMATLRNNGIPNTIVSFKDSSTSYIATISVQPVFPSNRGDCASINVVSTYTVNVGAVNVNNEQKILWKQPGNFLICSDNNVGRYQWGYDFVANGKPFVIVGQEEQTFIPDAQFLTKSENPVLNIIDYRFWVITYNESGLYTCQNKIYYNGPYSENNVSKFELASLKLNANPTKGVFDLMVKGDFYGNITVLVSDMLGKVIQQSNVEKLNGLETYHFDFTNLSVGIYVIQLSNDDLDIPLFTKFIIVK
jgi:hypothetical protein